MFFCYLQMTHLLFFHVLVFKKGTISIKFYFWSLCRVNHCNDHLRGSLWQNKIVLQTVTRLKQVWSFPHLEGHELVIRFWCPGIDLDALSKSDHQEFDSFVFYCKNNTWMAIESFQSSSFMKLSLTHDTVLWISEDVCVHTYIHTDIQTYIHTPHIHTYKQT